LLLSLMFRSQKCFPLITETFINIPFTTSCKSSLIHSKPAFNVVFRTYLKLPWKPLICIDGSTVYELDDKFNVRNKSSFFWCNVHIWISYAYAMIATSYGCLHLFIQQIVRHAESWNVSALEAIGQIFTPSFGRPNDWMFKAQ